MNADPLARAYRWIEYAAFGRALERCRFAQLSLLPDPERVLMLGEGDGRFLARFVRLHPAAQIDVLDLSPRMIAQASSGLSAQARSRVHFYALDVVTAPLPARQYNLIVTNFLLDCLSPSAARSTIAKVASCVPPGGLWIVSEFHQPPSGLARLHATLWLRVMYLFFRLVTGLRADHIPDYAAMLASNGFVLMNEHKQRFGLIVSQMWRKPEPAAV